MFGLLSNKFNPWKQKVSYTVAMCGLEWILSVKVTRNLAFNSNIEVVLLYHVSIAMRRVTLRQIKYLFS